MSHVFHMSEAGALALHAAVYLVKHTGSPCPARELTDALGGSSAHLVKVLQWMTRAGLVHTHRGPCGGYALTALAKRATIRTVIEAVEGPMTRTTCLLKHKACRGNACMMNDLLNQINRQVMTYVSRTPISALTPAFARTVRQRKKNAAP